MYWMIAILDPLKCMSNYRLVDWRINGLLELIDNQGVSIKIDKKREAMCYVVMKRDFDVDLQANVPFIRG